MGTSPPLFSRANVQGQPQGTAGRDSPLPVPTGEWGGDAGAWAFLKARCPQALSEATAAGSSARWEAQGAGLRAEDPVPLSP